MKEILLRKAMQGDTTAFGQIMRKYRSLVYAVALQIVGDSGAAQDISQDTFVSAFKALKSRFRYTSYFWNFEEVQTMEHLDLLFLILGFLIGVGVLHSNKPILSLFVYLGHRTSDLFRRKERGLHWSFA